MEIIRRYNIETVGKHAVVIGRSPILGKPVAMLLLNAHAAVTICHSRTKSSRHCKASRYSCGRSWNAKVCSG